MFSLAGALSQPVPKVSGSQLKKGEAVQYCTIMGQGSLRHDFLFCR